MNDTNNTTTTNETVIRCPDAYCNRLIKLIDGKIVEHRIIETYGYGDVCSMSGATLQKVAK